MSTGPCRDEAKAKALPGMRARFPRKVVCDSHEAGMACSAQKTPSDASQWHFDSLLLVHPFVVVTDDKDLCMEKTDNSKVVRWRKRLSACSFEVQHIAVIGNPVTDALSRLHPIPASVPEPSISLAHSADRSASVRQRCDPADLSEALYQDHTVCAFAFRGARASHAYAKDASGESAA
jgi:hypothetical protein